MLKYDKKTTWFKQTCVKCFTLYKTIWTYYHFLNLTKRQAFNCFSLAFLVYFLHIDKEINVQFIDDEILCLSCLVCCAECMHTSREG